MRRSANAVLCDVIDFLLILSNHFFHLLLCRKLTQYPLFICFSVKALLNIHFSSTYLSKSYSTYVFHLLLCQNPTQHMFFICFSVKTLLNIRFSSTSLSKSYSTYVFHLLLCQNPTQRTFFICFSVKILLNICFSSVISISCPTIQFSIMSHNVLFTNLHCLK